MERFKAVEKAMNTKAYSKEGLSASTKLDPKEQAKGEASDFLNDMVAELEMQIEALEAEGEAIQATMKKGKGHSAKADRMAAIERIIERHKWHQGKLELIRRSLENGGVEPDQVTDLEESIRYYVTDGTSEDFADDEGLYDDLNLEDEEDQYGMNQDGDKGSSQDTQSVNDDSAEPESRSGSIPGGKVRPTMEPAVSAGGRRPSTQLKSPLPTLATVHNPLPTIGTGAPSSSTAKPASLPTRPAGEGLKYASAAAAAAANDKIGIAPLPPPPGQQPVGQPPLPPPQARVSTTSSPSTASIQMASQVHAATAQQTERYTTPAESAAASVPAGPAPGLSKTAEVTKAGSSKGKATTQSTPQDSTRQSNPPSALEPPVASSSKAPTNGTSNGFKAAFHTYTDSNTDTDGLDDESIYHLPAALQDLVESFETIKRRGPARVHSPTTIRMLAASQANAPTIADAEPPKNYRPDAPLSYATAQSQYPQEPLPIFDNPQLYQRIDPDTLFYVFYYKQGTYQQYLAAKALKDQSWRFHKQYQTWFQRHEEPKAITEEFEQGTYRFFDYESTWYVLTSVIYPFGDIRFPDVASCWE
jgi:CCR4-NOT transcription complex subunit 3